MKKWFLIDLIASVPLDLITEFLNLNLNSRILNLFKAPRLFRIGRILKYLESMKYAKIIRILRLYLLLFLIAHWIGSFWVLIAQDEKYEKLALGEKYLEAVYESMLMILKNKLDDTKSTETQLFSMIVTFLGSCIIASIFGNMTVLIQNMDQSESHFRERMDLINEHLRYIELPKSLERDIRNFYEYLWIRHRSLMLSKDIFEDLSENLKKKLFVHQYFHIFKNVTLFNNVNIFIFLFCLNFYKFFKNF